MKTTEPPITSDYELAGYRAGAEQLRQMMERHEGKVMAERLRSPIDGRRVDDICYHLLHLYGS